MDLASQPAWVQYLAGGLVALGMAVLWLRKWVQERTRDETQKALTRENLSDLMREIAASQVVAPHASPAQVDSTNDLIHAMERLTIASDRQMAAMDRHTATTDRQTGVIERLVEETRSSSVVIKTQADEARRLNEELRVTREALRRQS